MKAPSLWIASTAPIGRVFRHRLPIADDPPAADLLVSTDIAPPLIVTLLPSPLPLTLMLFCWIEPGCDELLFCWITLVCAPAGPARKPAGSIVAATRAT